MRGSNNHQDGSSTPYCRCRVLYLGSAVPHASKEGLLGVQEPLRELYPEQGALGARGIDSWLSVWSNGLLLENVDEHRKKVTRFFPIESLHYCAAVRHVKGGNGNGSSDPSATRFFPLDSPFARTPSANHPPLFAAVLRRTSGIKVLECHAFICKRDMAANALVRCCFHAYADSRFAKGLEPAPQANGASTPPPTNGHHHHHHLNGGDALNNNNSSNGQSGLYHTLGGSSTTLADQQQNGLVVRLQHDDDSASLYDGDENHKVWARGRDELDGALYQEGTQHQGTMRSSKGSRLRQMIAPPPPPPPPPPPQTSLMGEDASTSASRKKLSGKKLAGKKAKQRQAEEQQQMHFAQQLMQQQPIYAGNGHAHHTLGHPRYHHHQHQQHHGVHHLPPSGMGGSSRSIAGTLARPAPVLLVPAATLPRKMHHHHVHPQMHPQMPRAIRPIPAAAPIVPVYYGTTTGSSRGARRIQQIPLALPDQQLQADCASLLGPQSRRLAASHADLSADQVDNNDGDSRFGTGIYRRKGHLNERAFSYSIRAEHRSRSHGSLASLGFAGQQQQQQPQNGGSPPGSRKEEKKDREMAQMVAGLSLVDDGLLEQQHSRAQQRNGGYHPQPLPRPKAR